MLLRERERKLACVMCEFACRERVNGTVQCAVTQRPVHLTHHLSWLIIPLQQPAHSLPLSLSSALSVSSCLSLSRH